MVVMVHTGTSVFPRARNRLGDPILVDDVAVDFPELKIILAHGGRPIWMRAAIFVARRFPNVYLEVSSIPPQSLLEYFPPLEKMASKVLFGTDWPAPAVVSIRRNLELFARLPLSDTTLEQILEKNPDEVFGHATI
jgi:predicted TIM-barrel fold metal-dependent hydrolase